jgi:hypothetical protein
MNLDKTLAAEGGTQMRKPPLAISSEEEFLSLMEGIDLEMAAEGVAITARPLMAGLKITKRYDVVLNPFPPSRPPKPGCFDPLEISIRIHDWVEQRYGERIKVPFHIGRVVIPLRGALYRINCPTIYGEVQFVCEPHSFGQAREALGVDEPPTCNMVDMIEDLTPDFARSLTGEEVIKIGTAFVIGMGAYSALGVISDVEYVREAVGDFDAAVFHLMEHRPQPGLSKWASLQAVEKLVKAYISQKGEAVKRTHSLQGLYDQAARLGLPAPPQQYLTDVQCPAGVRYGEVPVSVEEAVKSHLVSLELCEVAAQGIGQVLKRDMPVVPEPQVDGMPLGEFLKKHAVLRNK